MWRSVTGVAPLLVAATSAAATLSPAPRPTWTPNPVPTPVDLLVVRGWLNWEPTTDDDNLFSYRMGILAALFFFCFCPCCCCIAIYCFGPEEGPRERRLKAEVMYELGTLMKQGRTLTVAEAARVKDLMMASRPGVPLKEIEKLKCMSLRDAEIARVADEVKMAAEGKAKSRWKAADSFTNGAVRDAAEGRKVIGYSSRSITEKKDSAADGEADDAMGDTLAEDFDPGALPARS